MYRFRIERDLVLIVVLLISWFFICNVITSQAQNNSVIIDPDKAALTTAVGYIVEQRKFPSDTRAIILIESLTNFKEQMEIAYDASLANGRDPSLYILSQDTLSVYASYLNSELLKNDEGFAASSKNGLFNAIDFGFDVAAIATSVIATAYNPTLAPLLPIVAASGKASWDLIRNIMEDFGPSESELHRAWMYEDQARHMVVDIVNKAYENCIDDYSYCQVVTDIFNEHFGINPKSSFEEIRDIYPWIIDVDLDSFLNTHYTNNNEPITKENIEELIGGYFDRLKGKLNQDKNELLQELFNQQQSLIEAYHNPTPEEVISRLRAIHEEERKNYVATLTFATQLLSISEPKLSEEIYTVGGSLIQIWDATKNYSLAIKNFNSETTLYEKILPAVGMVSSVGSAVFAVSSLFGKNKSSSNQLVKREIAALRGLINQLRVEMHERFDRVDRALNEIMLTLTDRFNQIDLNLGLLLVDIQELQNSILEIQQKLNAMERYNQRYFAEISRGRFLDSYDRCIGYRERVGVDMTFETYEECERAFYRWATGDASNEIWAGPFDRNFNDEAILDNLAVYPLAVNINYLSALPMRNLGLSALSSSTVSNPVEWQNGADAYMQLVSEWPQHARQYKATTDRLGNIAERGMATKEAVLNISSTTTANLSRLRDNSLFNRVITKYIVALSNYSLQISDLENSYRLNELAIPGTSDYLNLWATAREQLVTASLGATTYAPLCSNSNQQTYVPGNGPLVNIDGIFKLGHAFNLRALSFCLISEQDPPPGVICGGGCTRIKTFSVRAAGAEIYRAFNSYGFPYNYTLTPSNSFELVRNNLESTIDPWLDLHRRDFIEQISSRLGVANNLSSTARLLTGIRTLLESYLILSMPNLLARHELLRALFYGDEAIVGIDELSGYYQQLMSYPDILSRSEEFRQLSFATERIDVFDEILDTNLIQSHETNSFLIEDGIKLQYIDNTLRKLEAVKVNLLSTSLTCALNKNSQEENPFVVSSVIGPKSIPIGQENNFNFEVNLKNIGRNRIKLSRKIAKKLLKVRVAAKKGCFKFKVALNEPKLVSIGVNAKFSLSFGVNARPCNNKKYKSKRSKLKYSALVRCA